MKKIMIVFGTRPEAIKMCPLISELRSRKNLDVSVCVTGQHREMLRSVLDVFGVTPDFDLDIMQHGQTLYDITQKVMAGMKSTFEKVRPDIVLVHGDTTTTFSAALSAFYSGIPVGHVEAGLRTYDVSSPYPEEFNRQAVDSIAQLHFAPTALSRISYRGRKLQVNHDVLIICAMCHFSLLACWILNSKSSIASSKKAGVRCYGHPWHFMVSAFEHESNCITLCC